MALTFEGDTVPEMTRLSVYPWAWETRGSGETKRKNDWGTGQVHGA